MSQIGTDMANELIELGWNKVNISQSIDDVNARLLWEINSSCLIYSRSNKIWYDCHIIDIITDDETNTEWLIVRYNKHNKKIQRFCQDIKPINLDEDYKYNDKIVQFIIDRLKAKENVNVHDENEDKKQDTIQYQIDLNMFKENNLECHSTSNEQIIINDCPHLLRLVSSLKYYHFLCKDNETLNDKQKFIDFCIDSYPMCLDDYIHLICIHSDSLCQIKNELVQTHDLKECKLNQCLCTRRHYGILNEINNKKEPLQHNLYINIFNTIHFYLFHMHDMGLRGLTSSITNQRIVSPDRQQVSDGINCIDVEFSAVQKQMEAIKKQNNLPTDEKPKFIINALDKSMLNENNAAKKDNIWTDNLFIYMEKNLSNPVKALYELNKYMIEEEFDTDAIKSDNDIYNNDCDKQISNISSDINDQCISIIKEFIQYYDIHCKKFSTGIAFFYWDWYKNIEKQQTFQQEQAGVYGENYNTFGIDDGKIYNLFVETYYDSLKSEAVSSGLIKMHDFTDNVINKANYYINTKKCKKIKSIHPRFNADPLHYGIAAESRLRKEHLQSLILYCNFTDFCTEFSSTFRPTYWDESIREIKSRNQKYHYISKYLRELIDYFGIRGSGMAPNGKESGPFYSGISIVLNISCFSIRLNGPTSTSKQIQVAINFAKRDGLILQINNQYFARFATFFDCSWVSCYPEEDERLFMGGRYRLELQSIRVHDNEINQWSNYHAFIRAFCLFDSMLSAEFPSKEKVTTADVKIVRMSIQHQLGIKNNKFDRYLQDTFALFCSKKSTIILSLYEMDKRINNKQFVSLIMEDSIIEQNIAGDTANNIFKSQVFALFPNLNKIVMYVTAGKYCYALNINHLLSIINEYFSSHAPNKSDKQITIKDIGQKWLAKSFDNISSIYLQQFQIELKTNIKGSYKNEDWLIICV